MTLTEFLVLQIAADEAHVTSALALHGSGTEWPLGHPLDPGRAAAECAAHLRIVELHAIDCWVGTGPDGGDEYFCAGCMGTGTAPTPDGVVCPTLAALASVYADRPGYSDEWRRP
jgi:hypothetical protein